MNEGMTPEDRQALRRAHELLERRNLAVQLGNLVGVPLETVGRVLPGHWRSAVDRASHAVIERLLATAIRSLDPRFFAPATPARQGFLCAASGAAGGAFGLPGVLLELPVTTMLLLRSVAGVAVAQGEDLSRLESRLACIQVFAFGGPSHGDDAAETGYYGVRLALAHHFSRVSEQVASSAGLEKAMPAAMELIQGLAARFGIVLSQKVTLQLTPLVGAASGAAVNLAFASHYRQVAEGHFLIRRLERAYGVEAVQAAFGAIEAEAGGRRATGEDRFSWWPEQQGEEPGSEPPGAGPAPTEEAAPEPSHAATIEAEAPPAEEAPRAPAADLSWLLEARQYLRILEHRPGRIVLRFSPAVLGAVPELAGQSAETLWRGIKGIEGLRISVWRRAITLDYDPAVVDPAVWSELIEGDDRVARGRLTELGL